MQNGRILKTPEPEVGIVSPADAEVRIACGHDERQKTTGRCNTKCFGRSWSAFASRISRSRTRYGRSGRGRQRRVRRRGIDDSQYCSKEHAFPGLVPVAVFFTFRSPHTCL